jgi:hypothetical protein
LKLFFQNRSLLTQVEFPSHLLYFTVSQTRPSTRA